MNLNNKDRAILPAGKYVVGDPCYAIPEHQWMAWLDAADFRNSGTVLAAELDGFIACGVETCYGDGTYFGNDGHEYPVDAGLIGLVAWEIADQEQTYESVVTFEAPVECYRDPDTGEIVLGSIIIPTGDEDEDDWYDEDEDF
ncbi:MAG: hypothetical protein E6Q97_12790 [Desulfurellales bacterium]|nr:MAG: hypothetical protein E6Q97_12790 [Desulfurellales bacterium]